MQIADIDPLPLAWKDCTVVVAASGPSLSQDDMMRVEISRTPTIAVNDAWKIAPWSDILYAADAAWWDYHWGALGFDGLKIIPHRLGEWADAPACQSSIDRWGLRPVGSRMAAGISADPRVVHEGGNSGFQAVNLAVLLGANRIILTGFDMGVEDGSPSHFFGDHPSPLRKNSPWDLFVRWFALAADSFKSAGVEVLNASRKSRLECFPMVDMETVL